MSEIPETEGYEKLHFKPGGMLKGKGSETLAGVFFFIHAFIRKKKTGTALKSIFWEFTKPVSRYKKFSEPKL
jgi:hypothetical protein